MYALVRLIFFGVISSGKLLSLFRFDFFFPSILKPLYICVYSFSFSLLHFLETAFSTF